MLARSSILSSAGLLLAAVVGCSAGDLLLPDAGEPSFIEIVQGDGQFGRVGEPLAEPLIARVVDSQGRPVADVPVALVLDDEEDAEVAPGTAPTDLNGLAGFHIVLRSRVGVIGGELRVQTARGGRTLAEPVRFTALSADAAGMTLLAGDGQSAPIGSTLPDPLVVQVADVFGNPIAGVPIGWSAEGGGSVSEAVVETDADGRSSVERTLGGIAGVQRTRASADGLVGSPVTFLHAATAGPPAQLALVSGDGQSALVGTPVPEELVVGLLDEAGNPIVGEAVTWVVGQGGGSVAPQTTPTGEGGRASTRWTLGPAPGEHTLTAVVSGVGAVRFHATALPGTPPGMRLVTQPAASARRGVLLSRQPVVQLRDAGGSDLRQAGVTVTVGAASAGGRVRGTVSRTTDDAGRATFTDLALEGPPGPHTLAFTATGFTGVISETIALARASTITVIESDTPDPSAPGASVRVVYSVRSDGGVVPGNVLVSAEDGANCRAVVSAGACSLALTRAGTQRITAAYEGAEEFEPSSDVEDHLVEAPATPVLALTTPPPGSAVSGVPFDTPPVVQLREGSGGDRRTAGVQITVAVASGGGTLIGSTSRTTDAEGRATFDGLGIAGGTGDHTLRFTAQGFTPVTSGRIGVSAVPTTTTIVSDAPDPSLPGQAVDVRFTVTAAAGTPTGDVTVSAGSGESCTGPVATGGCSLTLTQPGSRTLTARYAGAGAFAPSQDTEPHVVNQPPPSGPSPSLSRVTADPATVTVNTGRSVIRVEVRDAGGSALPGVPVQVSATGSGNAISPGSLATDGSGIARFEFSSSVAEAKTISATAGGVALEARPTVTVTRAPTTTRIESDEPDPSERGTPVTVVFTVTSGAGAPTGNVTVTGGGGSCTASVADGRCSMVLTTEGAVTLAARYAGDAAFTPSEDSEPHRVEAPAQRVLRLTQEPSEQAITGVPFQRQPEVQLAEEGGPDLREAGVTIAVLLAGPGSLQGRTTAVTDAGGRAAFSDLAITGEGRHTLEFSASGFRSVTSREIEVTRSETTTEITGDDPDPSEPGEAVLVRFRVTSQAGTPGGTVTVSAGDRTCSGSVEDGQCTIMLTESGPVTLTARYSGNDRFAPSSDTEAHVVAAANSAPRSEDDAFDTGQGEPLRVPAPGVLANDTDPDGDELRARLVEGPEDGELSLDGNGGFLYTPSADFTGTDRFTYVATDGSAESSPATVRITVEPGPNDGDEGS